MEQYQTILVLGIILILLIMIDIYRRIRRKKLTESQSQCYELPEVHTNTLEESTKETTTESFTAQYHAVNEQQEAATADNKNIIDLDDKRLQTQNEMPSDENDVALTDETVEEENTSTQTNPWQSAVKATREKRFRQPEVEHAQHIQTSFDLDNEPDQMIQQSEPLEDSEDNFLVFHIIAPRGYVFYGEDLETIFNLRHYHLSVHNTFEYLSSEAELLLTAINLEEPKTFGRIDAIQTTGVTLYCDIRKLKQPFAVFRDILSEAHQLAESLGGTLTNDHQKRFTQADFSRYMAKVKKAQHNL
ncbi:cell division protein ZipA C-terminal FtsZ-binding domain-containing protein [Thiotrichales bacterium 19S3-7]|nr:cell division protein ZipA C-terminal FtsZ-binding domain-containing protein [Thiotrichales bacterium 19S3-7]MCF6801783.1 cell division protein ZipA C-terminal FtsZ-binding domain-containing protein [Thiotrichales bacterium 19S3-11]